MVLLSIIYCHGITVTVFCDPESCFINTYGNICALCRCRDHLDNNFLTRYISKLKLHICPLNFLALDTAQYTELSSKAKTLFYLFISQGSKECINRYFSVSGKASIIFFFQ